MGLWGLFFLFSFFYFFLLWNLWCHHSSISSTLTIKAHYHNRSAPALITRKVTWFRSCFSLWRLPVLPGLSQRSPGEWRHQTLLGPSGIPFFSPHRVALKSEFLLIWVLTKTEQWVTVCNRFVPIRSIGVIQGVSILREIMHRARFFRLQPALSEDFPHFLSGVLILRLTDLLEN